ncbi:hypothetical protein V496_04939 [Pseudogymnoascus sp. VKM F-4515 (FW-2607)]|nr:hypothetical protein V496_04939 [Pseudogymnoascus sp. VKM F-4515 (FW-2607)]KFY77085.1 hypothetical protein V498_09429 [Pseudogymnoascus sp. VKM F-4517 (FW-2822)]
MPIADNRSSSGAKAQQPSQGGSTATTQGQPGTELNKTEAEKAAEEKASKEYLERMELEYEKREGGA